jgi:ribonuclease BN (tRNA processing enzyme)
VSHPGPTIGYRLEEDGTVLAYIPDHEPALGVADLRAVAPDWSSGFALAENADVLLHDAQYTEEEYLERVGWGHSSVADAVAFARAANVRRLIMFHHDPLHADGDLEDLLDRARILWGDDASGPALAFEGLELVVGPPG